MSITQQDHPVADSPSTPQPAETPREKRIRTLTTRNASIEAQLFDLTAQRTSLLCELYTTLHPQSTSLTSTSTTSTNPPTPSLPSSHHRPSTAAHTTPNSTPTPTSPAQQATLADAHAIQKHHIHLLHSYNEIRDIGLGLMGLIAEQRGLRIKDVQEEFGIDVKD